MSSEQHEQSETLGLSLNQDVAQLLGVPVETLADWDINRIRDDGDIDAYIPIEQMDVTGVPTDPNNVDRLVKLFDKRAAEVGGTGQRDPVVVGHVPGDTFYVLDGFHRHQTQVQRGITYLHATIEPRLTYEQVVQRRLEYAHAHPEIEFARQVEWVQSSWERTPWYEHIPNVLTAFRGFQDDYAYGGSDDIELLDGLSDTVFEEIRQWVAVQSKAWGYTPKEIRDNLAKVENFDRELMPKVYKGRGASTLGRISLKHVEIITATYPGEFDIQQAVVDAVIHAGLNTTQTDSLIKEVEKTNPLSANEVRRAVEAVDIDRLRAGSNSKLRPVGFGSIRGERSVTTERSPNVTVSEVLEQIREVLPKIQADGLSGNWGPAEIDNALEIGVVFAEILEQVTNKK